MQNRIANGAPSNRQIRNLQNGRVQLNNFVQRNNAAVLGRAIAGTDELPTVIAITRGGGGRAPPKRQRQLNPHAPGRFITNRV